MPRRRLAPVTVQGQRHIAVMFKITSFADNGRPRTLEVIYDDETVSIEGNERFVSGFVHDSILSKMSAS